MLPLGDSPWIRVRDSSLPSPSGCSDSIRGYPYSANIYGYPRLAEYGYPRHTRIPVFGLIFLMY